MVLENNPTTIAMMMPPLFGEMHQMHHQMEIQNFRTTTLSELEERRLQAIAMPSHALFQLDDDGGRGAAQESVSISIASLSRSPSQSPSRYPGPSFSAVPEEEVLSLIPTTKTTTTTRKTRKRKSAMVVKDEEGEEGERRDSLCASRKRGHNAIEVGFLNLISSHLISSHLISSLYPSPSPRPPSSLSTETRRRKKMVVRRKDDEN